MNSNRYLVKEGYLEKVTGSFKTEKSYLYLLNDILIITSEKSSQRKVTDIVVMIAEVEILDLKSMNFKIKMNKNLI